MEVNTDTAADQLKSFIERIERLEEEKSGLAADIREVFAGAKAAGFKPKIMHALIRLRKLEKEDRKEQEELLQLYEAALKRAEEAAFHVAMRARMRPAPNRED